MSLQQLPSEFPSLWEKNFSLFFISVCLYRSRIPIPSYLRVHWDWKMSERCNISMSTSHYSSIIYLQTASRLSLPLCISISLDFLQILLLHLAVESRQTALKTSYVHKAFWATDSVLFSFSLHSKCCASNNKKMSICSDKCEIVHVLLSEVIFDRNGAKVYVKNLRVLSQKKSANVVFWNLVVTRPFWQIVVSPFHYSSVTYINLLFALTTVYYPQFHSSKKEI